MTNTRANATRKLNARLNARRNGVTETLGSILNPYGKSIPLTWGSGSIWGSGSRKRGAGMPVGKQWIPDHELWAAVLLVAIKDFLEGNGNKVEGWFLNRDRRSYEAGGFIWICEQLDMDFLVPKLRNLVAKKDINGMIDALHLGTCNWKKLGVEEQGKLATKINPRNFRKVGGTKPPSP